MGKAIKVPATQAKNNFGELMHEATVNNREFIVTKHNRPILKITKFKAAK